MSPIIPVRSRLVLIAAILAIVGSGCSTQAVPASSMPSATPSTSPTASVAAVPLLSVETRGGECPNGPCGSVTTIRSDGAVHQVLPIAQDLGTIPQAELDALTVEIEQANFSLIESRPFTGQCPIAFDGQETIYTFHLPTGDEAIASCTVAIDPNHPLFRAIAAALAIDTP